MRNIAPDSAVTDGKPRSVTILQLAGLSLATLGLSMAVHAAGPASKSLTVDITAPAPASHAAWNSRVPYAVTVTYDRKSTKFGDIPANAVVLRAAYTADADATPRSPPLTDGIAEISRSNCTGCHDFSASSAGPSFSAIAKRYAGKPNADALLADHIRNGSHGTWGASAMPPHPDMSAAQAAAIARWIVTSAADPSVQYAIGKNGNIRMTAPAKPGPRAGMIVSAYYTGPLKPGDSRTPSAGRSTVTIHGGF